MFWLFLAVVIVGGAFLWLGMLKAWNTILEGAFRGLFLIIAGVLGFFGWRRYRERQPGKLPMQAAPPSHE